MLSKLVLLTGLVCLSTAALEPILSQQKQLRVFQNEKDDVQVQSLSLSSTDCVPNTTKANPLNRQTYFQCTRNGLALMKCPETMVFETVSSACIRDNTPPPGEPTPDCPVGSPNIYLRAVTTCAGFWQCSNAHAVYQSCPIGLVYNPTLHVCDWKCNVAPPCGTFTGVSNCGWKGAKTNFIPQNIEADTEMKSQSKWGQK